MVKTLQVALEELETNQVLIEAKYDAQNRKHDSQKLLFVKLMVHANIIYTWSRKYIHPTLCSGDHNFPMDEI